jgi:hypothetical protein
MLGAMAFAFNGLRIWSDRTSFLTGFLFFAIICASWLAWIAVVANLAGPPDQTRDAGILPIAIYIGGFALLVFLTGSLWSRMRGSLDDILRRDPRPPILFLRSFNDEGTRAVTNAELATYDAMRAYGPFIAIGKPGELRPAGAARIYLKNDKWRDVVLRLMHRSAAIVVAPGLTEGLDWEIGQIAARGHIDKSIFLFPPSPSGLERFKRLITLLGAEPQARTLAEVRVKNLLAVCHLADAGWLAVTAEYATPGVYEAVTDAALFGMWEKDRASLVAG